ncbi:MAG: PilN domain-containing protein [Bdellovibrionota bacterium]
MIKVNLLKSYSQVEADFSTEFDDFKQVRADFVKRVFIFLIGPLGLLGYEMYNIPELDGQKMALTSDLGALTEFNQRKEAIAGEISKYEEDKKRLNRQTQFLERISRERLFPLELVNSLKESIPAGVWLTGLNTLGNRLELRGGGDTEKAISDFEGNLTSTQILKNVKLQNIDVMSTNELKTSDLRIRSFMISAEYATSEGAKNE